MIVAYDFFYYSSFDFTFSSNKPLEFFQYVILVFKWFGILTYNIPGN